MGGGSLRSRQGARGRGARRSLPGRHLWRGAAHGWEHHRAGGEKAPRGQAPRNDRSRRQAPMLHLREGRGRGTPARLPEGRVRIALHSGRREQDRARALRMRREGERDARTTPEDPVRDRRHGRQGAALPRLPDGTRAGAHRPGGRDLPARVGILLGARGPRPRLSDDASRGRGRADGGVAAAGGARAGGGRMSAGEAAPPMPLDRPEIQRKLLHIAMGGFALFLAWLTWWQALVLALVALVHNYCLLHLYARGTIFRGEARTKGRDLGIVLYPASIAILILVLHTRLEIVAAAWGLLAFGDGFATIAGKAIGGDRKSVV